MFLSVTISAEHSVLSLLVHPMPGTYNQKEDTMPLVSVTVGTDDGSMTKWSSQWKTFVRVPFAGTDRVDMNGGGQARGGRDTPTHYHALLVATQDSHVTSPWNGNIIFIEELANICAQQII